MLVEVNLRTGRDAIRTLPETGEWVAVESQQYFLSNGAYYQAFYSGDGLVYQVVENPRSST